MISLPVMPITGIKTNKMMLLSTIFRMLVGVCFIWVVSRVPYSTYFIFPYVALLAGLVAVQSALLGGFSSWAVKVKLDISHLVLFVVLFTVLASVALNSLRAGLDLYYFPVLLLVLLWLAPALLTGHFRSLGIRIDWLVAFYAVLMLCLGAFELIIGRDLFHSRFSATGMDQGLVATGTFFNENDFAAAIVTLLPVVMYSFGKERVFRYLSLVYFVGCGLVLVLSLSRAAQVVYFMYLLVYTCWFFTNTKLYRSLYLLVLALALVAVFLFSFGDILLGRLADVSRIFNFILGDGVDNSGITRLRLMQEGWLLAVDQFWGFGDKASFVEAANEMFGAGLHDVHFFWIELAVIAGILPAALLFLGYLAAIAIHSIRILSSKNDVSYSVMVVLVALAFFVTAHGASSTLRYAWFWLIMLVSFNFSNRVCTE